MDANRAYSRWGNLLNRNNKAYINAKWRKNDSKEGWTSKHLTPYSGKHYNEDVQLSTNGDEPEIHNAIDNSKKPIAQQINRQQKLEPIEPKEPGEQINEDRTVVEIASDVIPGEQINQDVTIQEKEEDPATKNLKASFRTSDSSYAEAQRLLGESQKTLANNIVNGIGDSISNASNAWTQGQVNLGNAQKQMLQNTGSIDDIAKDSFDALTSGQVLLGQGQTSLLDDTKSAAKNAWDSYSKGQTQLAQSQPDLVKRQIETGKQYARDVKDFIDNANRAYGEGLANAGQSQQDWLKKLPQDMQASIDNDQNKVTDETVEKIAQLKDGLFNIPNNPTEEEFASFMAQNQNEPVAQNQNESQEPVDFWKNYAESSYNANKAIADAQRSTWNDVSNAVSPYFFNTDGTFDPVFSLSPDHINTEEEYNLYDDVLYKLRGQPRDPADIQFQKDMREMYKDAPNNLNYLQDVDFGDGQNDTAMYITGFALKRLREAGIPGRPIEDIDPWALYSKVSERDEFGFIPYIPDRTALNYYKSNSSAQKISDFWNDSVANLRRNIADYKVTFDGQEYSGLDIDRNKSRFQHFLKEYNDYKENMGANYSADEDPWITDTPDNEYSIPLTRVYTIKLDDGTTEQQTDEPKQVLKYQDGSYAMIFPDGTQWNFNDDADWEANCLVTLETDETNGDNADRWLNMEPLRLDDGRVIRADKAKELILNQDQYSDYGFNNWAKPDASLMEGDILPAMADLVLGSAPYFNPILSIPKSIADYNMTTRGFDYMRDYGDHSYSLLPEDIDDEKYASMRAAQLLMPLTEMAFGSIGPSLIPIAKKVGQQLAKRGYPNQMAELGIDVLGEGLEEVVPGNIIEEMTRNGISGWYANDVPSGSYDEEGNPIALVDETGHIVKDTETPWQERFVNFLEDAPEAALGGSMLGAAFAVPKINNALYYDRLKQIQNREMKEQGYGRYKTVIPGNIKTTFNEEDSKRLYGRRHK